MQKTMSSASLLTSSIVTITNAVELAKIMTMISAAIPFARIDVS
eukprot:SAG11_NODE_129_length_15500_cov_16.145250_6_plen_44_part_00